MSWLLWLCNNCSLGCSMAHGERLRYIGTLVRTHGINGALVLHCDSHRDAVQLRPGMTLQIGYSARFALPYTLRRFRSTPRGIILELEQVHTLAQARQLLEQGVFVAEDLVVPAQAETTAEYALDEVLGCTVITDEGAYLGTVVDVWLLPANDVWVVETESAYLPLPVISEVVRSVDLHQRRILVTLLPGLLEIAQPKRVHTDHAGDAADGVDAD